MNLHQELENIFPYLISIRKLESYVSIDIEFPKTWKFPKKFVDERSMVEQKTQKDSVRFFSFASSFDESSLNTLFTNINGIIKYNLEREEKENLFEEKIKELKQFFELNKLEDLKSLQFVIKKDFSLKFMDNEERENIKLVSEGT